MQLWKTLQMCFSLHSLRHQIQGRILNEPTAVAGALLRDDVQKSLEGVFKSHNLLNGRVSFCQLLQEQQTLDGREN